MKNLFNEEIFRIKEVIKYSVRKTATENKISLKESMLIGPDPMDNTTTTTTPATPVASSGQSSGKRTSFPTPKELENTAGIKAFQDWLDTNAKGWATGYKEGILKQGENGGGYGRFGPRTKKAWDTEKLKSAFLASKGGQTGSADYYKDYSSVEGDQAVEADQQPQSAPAETDVQSTITQTAPAQPDQTQSTNTQGSLSGLPKFDEKKGLQKIIDKELNK